MGLLEEIGRSNVRRSGFTPSAFQHTWSVGTVRPTARRPVRLSKHTLILNTSGVTLSNWTERNLTLEEKTLAIPSTDHKVVLDGSCRAVFVHGRNGTGKSSLLAHWARDSQPSVYLSADRTTRISGNAITQQHVSNVKHEDEKTLHRGSSTVHHKSNEYVTPLDVALFSISKSRLNKIEDIVGHVHSNIKRAQHAERSLVEHGINEILERIELAISLKVDHESSNGFKAQKNGSVYEVRHCSDGERGVLLLICQTVLAEPNSLIVMDEPDKHLYDKIVLPTLKELIELREDCYFAVGSALNLGELAWKKNVDFSSSWHDIELLEYDSPSGTWTVA